MGNLAPENVLRDLRKGALAPFYLFYGPEDLWLEITLDTIRKDLISESIKEFNFEMLYGGEISAEEILNRARLLPFMSSHRLIIVRRTERFTKGDLERFLPYLEKPVDSTCIIWVSGKAELSDVLYKRCKELGRAVHFRRLSERQIYPWIQKRAKEFGLAMHRDASAFLYQIVGNSLRELDSEISKLSLRHPNSTIEIEHIKELATFSRLFTVFNLVDYVSKRDALHALEALNRLFDTQGRDSSAALGILGMLARQMRLLLRTKAGLKNGKEKHGVVERLRPLPHFVIEKCIAQERMWQERELEDALEQLYDADGLVRLGSKGDLVLEGLIFRLCLPQNQ
ncbi:MAG: DNA polymerase III subunit delta [Deltaproteobacteria bacterium]|nr:DNA polymerase III subunit delta [Deltaproteobacteria bacterium]MBW2339897.1 DNA polymerase III subunit delta [Deltaproteobacteria bacterium]